jgi:hypothetical protein
VRVALFHGSVAGAVVLLSIYPLLLLTSTLPCDMSAGMGFAGVFEGTLASVDILPSMQGYLQKMRTEGTREICILKEVYAFDALAMMASAAVALLVMVLALAQAKVLRPIATPLGRWFASTLPDGMRGVRWFLYGFPIAFAVLIFWWLDWNDRSRFRLLAGRVHLNEYFVLNDTAMAALFSFVMIHSALLFHYDRDAGSGHQ